MNGEHILQAYRFDGVGGAEPWNVAEKIDADTQDGKFGWLHIAIDSPRAREFLQKNTDLDPLIIEAMLAEETRPRALIKRNGMLVVLRAMNLNSGQEPEDMISLRMWITENIVISTRRRDIKAIKDIVAQINSGRAPRSAGELLTNITDRVFNRMEPRFADLADHAAELEALLSDGSEDILQRDVALMRKRIAIFIRYTTPQKALLQAVVTCKFEWLQARQREHLAESLDQVVRYVEELQELRDRAQIINDEINNAHNGRLNDITYIFSVAATIFLPLTFLTGLMGINVGGIPGAHDETGFLVFVVICSVMVIAQVAIFRKLKWF